MSRSVLRARLLDRLLKDKRISFNKSLDHYEVKDGKVICQFTDGSTATGDFVVGADGVKSKVKVPSLIVKAWLTVCDRSKSNSA